MKADLETITPAQAKEMLERNITNRRLSERRAYRYASDMKSGRWFNNGQTVVLTAKGDLLDGQHRLKGIILAGTPVTMLVVRGADPKSFVTMDSGASRSLSDVLTIEGYQYTAMMAGAARLAWCYAAGVNLKTSPTVSVLNEFIGRHEYLPEIAQTVGANMRRIMPPSPLIAVLFLANEKREMDEEVAQFLEGVLLGTGLYKGDARLALRDWLDMRRGVKGASRTNMQQPNVFGAIGRAWDSFSSGQSLLHIKAPDYPTRENLPIHGFEPRSFADLADVARQTTEAVVSAQRANHKSRLPPKVVETA